MLSTWIQSKKDEEGFTLIELLVVVIIIGILAAIAIPVFLNQRQSAWERTATADARNAAISMETALTRTGNYPADGTGTGTMNNFSGNTAVWNLVETTATGAVAIQPAATTINAATEVLVAEIAVSNGVALVYDLLADEATYTLTAYHDELGGSDASGGVVTAAGVAFYHSGEGGIVDSLT